MTISRRNAIKVGLGGAAAAYSISQLPMLAFAADPAITDDQRDKFVRFSSKLIHVQPKFLRPPVPQDSIQLCDIYYGVLKAAAKAEAFNKFSTFISENGDPKSLFPAGKPLASEEAWAARMTMMMWLFGGWYGYTERSKMAAILEKSLDPKSADNIDGAMPYFQEDYYKQDYVISSRAYANGWIWRIAQAHPMGVSQFAFGSWADKPPSLSEFGFSSIA